MAPRGPGRRFGTIRYYIVNWIVSCEMGQNQLPRSNLFTNSLKTQICTTWHWYPFSFSHPRSKSSCTKKSPKTSPTAKLQSSPTSSSTCHYWRPFTKRTSGNIRSFRPISGRSRRIWSFKGIKCPKDPPSSWNGAPEATMKTLSRRLTWVFFTEAKKLIFPVQRQNILHSGNTSTTCAWDLNKGRK